MKIIIFTTNQIRHQFFIDYMSRQKDIKLVACFVEKNLHKKYQRKIKLSKLQKKHFNKRNLKEKIFFSNYLKKKNLKNISYVPAQKLSKSKKIIDILKKKNYDFVISFGCSIIDDTLLKINRKKFLNIHLGLSPYYLGSGTNFWPFSNNELQFLGATIMRTSKKLDQGSILHQIRLSIKRGHDIHDVGNLIILKIVKQLKYVLKNLNKNTKNFTFTKYKTKVYKRSDFNDESLKKAYKNIENGMISKYLIKKKFLEKKYKIINLKECI